MAFMADGYLYKIVCLQKNCIDSFLVHRPIQGKTSYVWAKQSLIFETFQNTFSLIYSGLLYQFLESRSKSVQHKKFALALGPNNNYIRAYKHFKLPLLGGSGNLETGTSLENLKSL